MVLVKGGFPGSLESAPGCVCGCITEPPNPPEMTETAMQVGIVFKICACFCGSYDSNSPLFSASRYNN